MGGKKAPPKLTAEEKDAQAKAKALDGLLKAAKNDDRAKCEALVAKGADVNAANEHGQTPGHMAAGYGALDVLRFLHSQGADLTVQNEV